MERLDRCNLCDGTRFSLFAEMDGHKTKHRFRIVTCDDCGLMFVSPRLSSEENLALYDEAYFNGDGFDATVNYVMLDSEGEARRGENDGILAKIALLQPGLDVRILDVGCGTGFLLRALAAAGYRELSGVELSGYAADIAKKAAPAKVFVGDILELDLPPAHFDVINATEVIEHLRDPAAFFRRIKSLLAPGGVFIYSTGNARSLYARVLGKRWPYLHPEGHLFYYSPETMTRYFRQAGLEPMAFTRFDGPKKRAYLHAEDLMANSMLRYVGKSDRGMRGRVFRVASALATTGIVQRALTRLLGKHKLPIAIQPRAPG